MGFVLTIEGFVLRMEIRPVVELGSKLASFLWGKLTWLWLCVWAGNALVFVYGQRLSWYFCWGSNLSLFSCAGIIY